VKKNKQILLSTWTIVKKGRENAYAKTVGGGNTTRGKKRDDSIKKPATKRENTGQRMIGVMMCLWNRNKPWKRQSRWNGTYSGHGR